MLSVLFLASLFFGSEPGSLSAENDECPLPTYETGLNVYLFYGQGCPHCAKVEPYLAEMKQKHRFSLHKYDIYNSRSSLSLFDEYCNTHGLPLEHRGVPTVFLADTYFVGGDPILNNFEDAVRKALKTDSPASKTSETKTHESPNQRITSSASSLSLITVTFAGIIDSISPCSIAILVFLIGARILVTNRRKRALRVGLAFCTSVFISYFLFGLGLLTIVQLSGFSNIFSIFAGLFAFFVGVFYLKDAFWHGGGGFVMEVPHSLKPLLMKMLKGVTSPLGAFAMGFVASSLELPCTSGPYLFILGQLADNTTRLHAIPLLLYYNFLFVLPLILASLLLYSNMLSLIKAREWNDGNKSLLRFLSGLALIALGFFVIPDPQAFHFIQVFLSGFKAFSPVLLGMFCLYLIIDFASSTKVRFLSGTFLILLGAISLLMPPLNVAVANSGDIRYAEAAVVWSESTEAEAIPLIETSVDVRIDSELMEKARLRPDEVLRLIVVFHKKPTDYGGYLQSINGKTLYDYEIIEGIAVAIPGRNLERLKELTNIVSIHEDRVMHASLDESVPLINADNVWVGGINGSGIDVCIVDTGVDYNHPALAGKVVAQKCYCCKNPLIGCGDTQPGYCPDGTAIDDDAMDDNGHGTHCAGIVASTNDTYKGVAPASSLMAVKVLDSKGQGYESDIIAGIEWCSNQDADVISISLGGGLFTSYCDDEPDAQAVNNAVDAGAFVAVASGNDASTTHLSAPACASKGTSVGATYDADVGGIVWGQPEVCRDTTTHPDKIACITNRDDILDLLAPGALITSTVLNSQFGTKGGTSMAAPHVAGTAALLLEAKPTLTPSQVEAILKKTGKNIYDSETDLTFPRVNASAAVDLPPIGHLEPYLIEPTSDRYVPQNEFFNFTSGVRCVGGDCGNVSATLGTSEIAYDDNSAENAWAWSDESNMWAVRFTPTAYPVTLKTGRFYIYPGWPDPGNDNFNVSIFDNDGADGAPGTLLGGPISSGAITHGWADVNVSSLDITVTDGDFYIALIQIGDYPYSVGVGTDEDAPWAQRSWGRNVAMGEDWQQLDNSYGNIRISAVVSTISTMTGDTPFYTTSENPQTCLNLNAGGECNQIWQVNATGNPDSYEFHTVYNPTTHAWYIAKNKTEKIKITIVVCPVYNLNTDIDYPTIQEAIDASETSDGHTLLICPGTYHENINVTKPLSIKSLSANPANTIVTAYNPADHVFSVQANNVNISGLTVAGAEEGAGISITGFNNSRIYHNTVINNSQGIQVRQPHCAYHNISNNIISATHIGIWLEGSSFNLISHNTINANHIAGIRLNLSSHNNTITFNNISQNEKGIILAEGALDNNISYNNIFDNTWNLYNGQTSSIAAEHNWWGERCCYYLDSTIYDDEEGTGQVDFTPALDSPYPIGSPIECWKCCKSTLYLSQSEVPRGASVEITCLITDIDTSPLSGYPVEIYADNALLASDYTDTNGWFDYTWTPSSAGLYAVKCVIYDEGDYHAIYSDAKLLFVSLSGDSGSGAGRTPLIDRM